MDPQQESTARRSRGSCWAGRCRVGWYLRVVPNEGLMDDTTVNPRLSSSTLTEFDTNRRKHGSFGCMLVPVHGSKKHIELLPIGFSYQVGVTLTRMYSGSFITGYAMRRTAPGFLSLITTTTLKCFYRTHRAQTVLSPTPTLRHWQTISPNALTASCCSLLGIKKLPKISQAVIITFMK